MANQDSLTALTAKEIADRLAALHGAGQPGAAAGAVSPGVQTQAAGFMNQATWDVVLTAMRPYLVQLFQTEVAALMKGPSPTAQPAEPAGM